MFPRYQAIATKGKEHLEAIQQNFQAKRLFQVRQDVFSSSSIIEPSLHHITLHLRAI